MKNEEKKHLFLVILFISPKTVSNSVFLSNSCLCITIAKGYSVPPPLPPRRASNGLYCNSSPIPNCIFTSTAHLLLCFLVLYPEALFKYNFIEVSGHSLEVSALVIAFLQNDIHKQTLVFFIS
jgi:hypothetical protein